MIRKYQNHTLQTNPPHREEESQNIYNNKTSVRQQKQGNLPPPPRSNLFPHRIAAHLTRKERSLSAISMDSAIAGINNCRYTQWSKFCAIAFPREFHQGLLSTFFSHQHISQRAVRTSLEWQFALGGWGGGSVSVRIWNLKPLVISRLGVRTDPLLIFPFQALLIFQ